jgi:hypothetical protein
MPNERAAFKVATHLTNFYLRDFLREDFQIIHHLVQAMIKIIELENPHIFLRRVSIPPYFCVSWMLTWLAHDLKEIGLAKQVFDFLIVREPYAIIYLSAAISLSITDYLEELEEEELHQILKELPAKLDSVDGILADCDLLMKKHPWRKICPPELESYTIFMLNILLALFLPRKGVKIDGRVHRQWWCF